MVRAQAEAGGIKAVQSPDTTAEGAALHPQECLFRQSLRRDFLRLLQNRFPDGAGSSESPEQSSMAQPSTVSKPPPKEESITPSS